MITFHLDHLSGSNRSSKRDHLPSCSLKESPSSSCPIATNYIGSWRTYLDEYKGNTFMLTRASQIGDLGHNDQIRSRSSRLSMLLFLNGQWDRDRLPEIIDGFKAQRIAHECIDSHHLVSMPKIQKSSTISYDLSIAVFVTDRTTMGHCNENYNL